MEDSSLRLVVFDVERIETFPLPRRGQIHIGRSFDCEVRIDHASVSRRHARVTIAEDIVIEDLESASGTSVRGAPARAGSPIVLRPGETIELGGVTAMVQRRAYARRTRTAEPYGLFMQRLDVECRRALSLDLPLALVRARVESPIELDAELSGALRGSDLIGRYSPGEYLLALIDTPAHRVPEVLHRLRRRLESGGARVHFGSALAPRDGRHAHALLEHASVSADGVGRMLTAPIVQAPTMRHLHSLIEQLAQGSELVYFHGAAGVGKTFLAERLHRQSERRQYRLERIDASQSSSAELATQIEAALARVAKGTLLIENLSAANEAAKVQLATAMERARAVSARVVATGASPIEDLTGTQLFVPPLSARQGEIEPLARSFARAICHRDRRVDDLTFAPEVFGFLRGHAWPGNVCELRNVIERAAALSSDEINFRSLPDGWEAEAHAPQAETPAAEPDPGLRDVLDDYERRRILEVLQRCAGNQTRAAVQLGISRRTLVTRLSQWGMTRRRA